MFCFEVCVLTVLDAFPDILYTVSSLAWVLGEPKSRVCVFYLWDKIHYFNYLNIYN